MRKKTFDEFISEYKHKCKENGWKEYYIPKQKYNGAREYLTVVCNKHGEFNARPTNLLRGKASCRKCRGMVNNMNDFIKKYRSKCNSIGITPYKILSKKYIGEHDNIELVCPIHGNFYISPSDLIQGRGCAKCSQRRPMDIVAKEVSEKTGGEYKLLSFSTSYEKSKFLHKSCGNTFLMTTNSFLSGGSRCPHCSASLGERLVFNILKEGNVEFNYQKSVRINGKLHIIDFEIPSVKMFIEVQGKQHFYTEKDKNKLYYRKDQKKRDLEKLEYAHTIGYDMVYIYYKNDGIDIKEIYRVLNENGVNLKYKSGIRLDSSIIDKVEIANYYKNHSIKDTATRFNVCINTVYLAYKSITGHNKLIIHSLKEKINIANYYKTHTVEKTANIFGVAPRSVVRYYELVFKTKKGRKRQRTISKYVAIW